jgi:hypothetical protein
MFQSSLSGMTLREDSGHYTHMRMAVKSRTHCHMNSGSLADDFFLLGKYHGNDA